MKEVTELQNRLTDLKESLRRGDQRRLATLLKSHPNRIGNAFSGFVSDEAFLRKLVAATEHLTKANASALAMS